MDDARPGDGAGPDLLDRWLEHRALTTGTTAGPAGSPETVPGPREPASPSAVEAAPAPAPETHREFVGTRYTGTPGVSTLAGQPSQPVSPAPPAVSTHPDAGATVLAALRATAPVPAPPRVDGSVTSAVPRDGDVAVPVAGPPCLRRAASRQASPATQPVPSFEDSAAAERAVADEAAVETRRDAVRRAPRAAAKAPAVTDDVPHTPADSLEGPGAPPAASDTPGRSVALAAHDASAARPRTSSVPVAIATETHDATEAQDAGLTATPAPIPAPIPAPAPPPEPAASVVTLHPRRSARRVLGALLLGAVALTALTAYVAHDDPTTASLGVAGAFAALTLVLWAVRASTSTATVVLDHGVLDIHAHGSHHRFDLRSHYAVLSLHGEPGQRRWRAQFERRGLPPYVVDRSMVDPAEFVAAVRRFRPDL